MPRPTAFGRPFGFWGVTGTRSGFGYGVLAPRGTEGDREQWLLMKCLYQAHRIIRVRRHDLLGPRFSVAGDYPLGMRSKVRFSPTLLPCPSMTFAVLLYLRGVTLNSRAKSREDMWPHHADGYSRGQTSLPQRGRYPPPSSHWVPQPRILQSRACPGSPHPARRRPIRFRFRRSIFASGETYGIHRYYPPPK